MGQRLRFNVCEDLMARPMSEEKSPWTSTLLCMLMLSFNITSSLMMWPGSLVFRQPCKNMQIGFQFQNEPKIVFISCIGITAKAISDNINKYC